MRLYKFKFPIKIMSNHPVVMGILNITPDSFSDGGQFFTSQKAVQRAIEMVEEGAEIIDVGGESSRPGAQPLNTEEEIKRVIPVIKELSKKISIPISVDTSKPAVAEQAIDCGAMMVNDITALRGNPQMAKLISRKQVKVILMHMQGHPQTMQKNPSYQNVVAEINDFFSERIKYAEQYNISKDKIILDPGIGFGKTLEHNLEILRHLDTFKQRGYPLCLGVSRKAFIGQILDLPVQERLEGSLATAVWGAICGVDILRVHDVKATVRVVRVIERILSSS